MICVLEVSRSWWEPRFNNVLPFLPYNFAALFFYHPSTMTSKFSDESTTPLYSTLSEDGSYPDLEQIVQHKSISSRFSRVLFILNVTLFAFTLVLFASVIRQQIEKLPAQSDAIKETSYFCTQPV
jgi:hypothetical protein